MRFLFIFSKLQSKVITIGRGCPLAKQIFASQSSGGRMEKKLWKYSSSHSFFQVMVKLQKIQYYEVKLSC